MTILTELDTQTLENLRAAHIVHGRSPEQRFSAYQSIGDLLAAQTARQPNKVFLIHYNADGQREDFTYAQFSARVHQTAHVLVDLGVRCGDRVATIAYNHSETVIAYFACWLIGATVAPQNVA